MTSSPQPARTWHSHYDDPNGDLILISNESVKFRISARLLAKACDDFGNLPVYHPLTIHGPGSTVHLEYSTDSVENYEETLQLLAVADHFHSDRLFPYIKEQLYTFTDHYAAKLLAWASTRNDWEMGRRIIQRLDKVRVKEILARPGGLERFFDNLRPEWRHTLIELIFFATFNDKKLLYGWQNVHEDFVPPDEEEEEQDEEEEELDETGEEEGAVESAETTGGKRKTGEGESARPKRAKVAKVE